MTLREYLETKAKKNEMIYVGSNTGFVCIETGEKIVEELELTGNHLLDQYHARLSMLKGKIMYLSEKIENSISRMETYANTKAAYERILLGVDGPINSNGKPYDLKKTKEYLERKDDQIDTTLKDLEKIGKTVTVYHRGLVNTIVKINTFVPFLDREVIGTWPRTIEERGTIVKIEGTEEGPYWNYTDYISDKKKWGTTWEKDVEDIA